MQTQNSTQEDFRSGRRNRHGQIVTDASQMQSSATIDNDSSLPVPSKDEIASDVEKVLTFAVKQSGTNYRQGMNEILGPFLWLAIRDSLGLVETFPREAASLRSYSRDPWSTINSPGLGNEDDWLSQESL